MGTTSLKVPTRQALVALLATAALVLSACSGGGSTPNESMKASPGAVNTAYKGTTINVMLPPWGAWPKADLQKFTAETGIQVKMNTLAWDSIHDKVVTSEAGGQAPADVVEMDWTWVSQFGAAGWFADLNKYLSPSEVKNSIGANLFVSKGKQIGLPYSLDFRGSLVNMTMFKKAGIDSPPTTWAEVVQDSAKLQQSGIAHPVGLPLKILEGTSTPWYALVRGSNGQILDSSGDPQMAGGDQSAKALDLIHTLYAKGYVDPGSIGLSDQQVGDNFNAGKSAMIIAAGPGGPAQAKDPKVSSVSHDDIEFVHLPGMQNATGPVVGLEEALAIPENSKQKGAAAMFISWWMKTPQLLSAYSAPDMGLLPTTQAGLQELDKQGKLLSSKAILEMVPQIQPIFPGGAPTWYGKFSASAAQVIQAVALGKETPSQGVTKLTATAKSLKSAS